MECLEYCEVAKECLFGDVHDGKLSQKGPGNCFVKVGGDKQMSWRDGETGKASG